MTKIGIECHLQLNTKSKIFCSCSTKQSGKPNSNVCEICCGFPGAKPVLNKEAFEKALKIALALNCKINKKTFFSRKSYFYPDLPKNFQITQYEAPLGYHGNFKGINIRRIHLEEDPGALIHKSSYCLVDYNRSGIPLVEIVTEPDFKDPKEVREFLKKLVIDLSYLDVYDKKSEFALKADLNVSTTGAKVEIKNVTGLKDIEDALSYEIERQEKDVPNSNETRGWNSDKGITFLQRVKESEDDYGYITETDLPIIEVSDSWINEVKKTIPELSEEKASRFTSDYQLKESDSKILSSNKKLAHLFEEVSKKVDSEIAAKWIIRDLTNQLNYHKKTLEGANVKSEDMIELLKLFEEKKITDNTAKEVIIKIITEKNFSPLKYIEENNLIMKSDTSQIEVWCKQAIKESYEAVEAYKNGNEKSLNFLVGKVMQISKKTANPDVVRKILDFWINEAQQANDGRLPHDLQTNSYNSMDGTMWLLKKLFQYYEMTGDLAFLEMKEKVILKYFRGMIANYINKDGFVKCGPLDTWMIIPREGFPVEVQALNIWNCWKYSQLYPELNEITQKAVINFELFSADEYLADRIDFSGNVVDKITPNQLFALEILSGEPKKQLLNTVRKKLADKGIRTLASTDKEYKKDDIYSGAQWPWLNSFAISGELEMENVETAYKAYLEPLVSHATEESGYGGIDQYFNGDGSAADCSHYH
ncbi:Asp-tRNA(Asn)/Glu-tRNA(Gln) amidotransferase subunit GatB, partial [Candidatus Woesearchaeota archaeon]|nr:Asp-tRNA(Asn)/Glu-tRNA(Gln) amidotransferase subunit GatB [Candidatus Woesearchaeota archaeon]